MQTLPLQPLHPFLPSLYLRKTKSHLHPHRKEIRLNRHSLQLD